MTQQRRLHWSSLAPGEMAAEMVSQRGLSGGSAEGGGGRVSTRNAYASGKGFSLMRDDISDVPGQSLKILKKNKNALTSINSLYRRGSLA